jgi:hypothetical protein
MNREAKMMTLNEALDAMEGYFRRHPTQRCGQAYFNGLHEVAPEIADAIRGTADDPFYDNKRFDRFINRVADLCTT